MLCQALPRVILILVKQEAKGEQFPRGGLFFARSFLRRPSRDTNRESMPQASSMNNVKCKVYGKAYSNCFRTL